jgi:hypothetical protein
VVRKEMAPELDKKSEAKAQKLADSMLREKDEEVRSIADRIPGIADRAIGSNGYQREPPDREDNVCSATASPSGAHWMSRLEPKMDKVLRAVDSAERERSPASPKLIAETSGLEEEQVKVLLAEAQSKGWTFYFNSAEETSLPTAPGWILMPAGQAVIEENGAG